MKRYFLGCALLLFAAAIASPAGTISAALVGQRVARVNGVELTDRDLLREMYSIFPYARQHNGGFPKAMEADIRNGALKMIIFEELVYQEARRRKMAIPPAKMARAMSDFRKQFAGPEEYQQFLKTEFNASTELVKARVERSLLIEQLLKNEVGDKTPVSVAEAKVYYQKNPDRFRIAESFAIQTISIVPPPNATAAQLKEASKRAEEALRQARATKNYEEFGMLAEKISEDDYRVMMGDHRAVDRSKLPPAVLQALLALKPGQMSGLIQFDQVYSVVRLNGHIDPGMQKFETVKDALRAELQKGKAERLRSGLGKKLRANARVEEF